MIYLSLGTNIGDREANLQGAIALIRADDEIQVCRQSSIYETAPTDVLDQPWFLNMVLECKSSGMPMQLVKKLLGMEKQMGRDRSQTAIARGPRLIDIDVLLYGRSIIETPQLTVPHPRMLQRRFVLEPLVELKPSLKDPITGIAYSQSLLALKDQDVKRR